MGGGIPIENFCLNFVFTVWLMFFLMRDWDEFYLKKNHVLPCTLKLPTKHKFKSNSINFSQQNVEA